MTLGVYSSADTSQARISSTPPEKTSGSKGEGTRPGAGSARDEKSKQSETSGAGAQTGAAADTGAKSQESLAGLFQDEVNGAKAGYAATGDAAAPSSPDASPEQAPAAAGSTHNTATPEKTSADQTAAQRQMFSSFVRDLDPATQQRLSTWLPDALNGGASALKDAAKGLTVEQATDLNALAETMGIEAGAIGAEAGTPTDAAGIYGAVKSAASDLKANLQPLEQIQQRFGEHAIKEATPQLAPSASYEVDATLQDSKDAIYQNFTSGLDQATRDRLETWLPASFEDRGNLPNSLNDQQDADLLALAELHGLEDRSERFTSLQTAFKRDLNLETAGELPSVVDMMLVQHDSKESGSAADDIKVAGDDILGKAEELEKKGFGELDSWLPEALAGRGEVPFGDAKAMDLLADFAKEMGFEGAEGSRPEDAFAFLKDSAVIDKAMHSGQTAPEKAYLLFSDSFLDSTLQYGERNNALTGEQKADAAALADKLLGPDDGSGKPAEVSAQALMAAVTHRTDEPLHRPQELMAAAGYINKADTRAEQKERLAASVLAFHVREEIGTPPMTARTWAESFGQVHDRLPGQLNEQLFNAPHSNELTIVADHLGVPGEHEFMIDKKREIRLENDALGNVDTFDQGKIKQDKLGAVLDIAIPVVATALTFTGWGTAVGVALNTAYSAYKGAQAIKEGDLVGGALAIAGAVSAGAASGFSAAANAGMATAQTAQAAATAARTVQAANAAFKAYQSAEDGDVLGAVTGGLGAFADASGASGLKTVVNVTEKSVDVADDIKDGDYLAAAQGAVDIGRDISSAANGGKSNSEVDGVLDAIDSGIDIGRSIEDGDYIGALQGAAGLALDGKAEETANQIAGIAHSVDDGDYIGAAQGAAGLALDGKAEETANQIAGIARSVDDGDYIGAAQSAAGLALDGKAEETANQIAGIAHSVDDGDYIGAAQGAAGLALDGKAEETANQIAGIARSVDDGDYIGAAQSAAGLALDGKAEETANQIAGIARNVDDGDYIGAAQIAAGDVLGAGNDVMAEQIAEVARDIKDGNYVDAGEGALNILNGTTDDPRLARVAEVARDIDDGNYIDAGEGALNILNGTTRDLRLAQVAEVARDIDDGNYAGAAQFVSGEVIDGSNEFRALPVGDIVRDIKNGDYIDAAEGVADVFLDGKAEEAASQIVDIARDVKDGDYVSAGERLGNVLNGTSNEEAIRQVADVARNVENGDYLGAAEGLANVLNGTANDDETLSRGLTTNDEQVILPASYEQTIIDVGRGDTLSEIAERHGTTVDALMAANPEIEDPSQIATGQRLTLPPGAQQDKLAEFAQVQGNQAVIMPTPPRPVDILSQPNATHPNANRIGLSDADFQAVADRLGVDIAAVKAVAEVESRGDGFLPSGEPKILFERHKFSQKTLGNFDSILPDISNQSPGGYGQGGEFQHQRLAKASTLDETAALESASWGRFQILGENYLEAGYPDVESFVADMRLSEAKQLDAFAAFIQSDPRKLNALENQDWATFARLYNGPGYKQNSYDVKLDQAYQKYSNP